VATAEPGKFERYLSGHYARLGDQQRYRARRKRQLLGTYAHLLPAARDAEMLEIGPGFGQWLEALRADRGYARALAVDLSPEVVEFCNHILPGSTSLEPDTVDFLLRHAGRYDRIFAFHVLEHVPAEALEHFVHAMRVALKPGGLCVVEVPNMANMLTGGFLRYGDLTHETGFTELSLRQVFEEAGFADIHCFEDRLVLGVPQDLLAMAFRWFVGRVQRLVYRGYQLPVPAVLTPVLCMRAASPGPATKRDPVA
jgi:SAM-dependent methyltransferase